MLVMQEVITYTFNFKLVPFFLQVRDLYSSITSLHSFVQELELRRLLWIKELTVFRTERL